MRYLCNLDVYITVEAATLIGLTFVAATSYLYRSVMARKKKTGAPKPPQSTGSTSTAPKAVTGADAKGLAPAKSAAVAAPVIQEVDTRPENSPYGSPACTVPFASPLTVPLDILKKSPKLHAAYDNRLPELPAIPQDVGHVLVHYLHTGSYQSLRPTPTDTMSKQICELRTSIQAYAAARTYDLPDLMRLAEAKIDKYGQGLPLPALLEVAQDAYPTLTEGDAWFLDYLRSRIRPHLKDPKSLMGSNLLDQISSILSPNRVLLRTVLELFCERIVVRSEPATSPPASTIASPITSPGTSRPVSPLPPASPMSLLEMRSRSVMRDEFTPARKNLKATPWPSPDNMSEASWSRSMSPEPLLPEAGPPMFEAKPVPAPALAPFPELGPVILDVMPPPGPSIEAKAVPVVEPEVEPVPVPEVKIAIEPEQKVEPEPEVKLQIEHEAEVPVEVPVKLPVELELEAPVEISVEAPVEVPVELPRDAYTEPETMTTVEAEIEQKEEAVFGPIPMAQRERKDSGKGIDLEPLPKELESIPEHVSELETESRSNPQPQIRPAVLREADSGFWEGHDVEFGGKEPAPSVIELEPVPEPALEPAHELDSIASPNDVPGVDTRDFAGSDADVKSIPDKQVETDVDALEEHVPEPLPTQESASETATDTLLKDHESQPELEPLPIKSAEAAPQKLADATTLLPEITPAQELPEMAQGKEVEAQPEPEKVEPLPRGLEQGSLLTIRQFQEETVEPEAVAKPEPEPEPQADSLDPIHLSDAAEPTGPVEPKAAQPSVDPGPKPAGKSEIQRANTDSAVHAAIRAADLDKPATVLGTKPAPEQEGAKTEADAADVQPCSAQVRQRSWKKRFLSLRYPVLFGRGM
ncbi:hypothetical protein C8A01DRAFT_19761 [Parachaetomium inaequale]|uniref:Uncharacterized protein n=1 Tax=Parachaetomium inaequale TaxID=2588326 RepID=A0AAN6PAJ3_9PEZI|nr:hypothetical protein C8A01DRAFT_19761 [Parachaetomium inaequale]